MKGKKKYGLMVAIWMYDRPDPVWNFLGVFNNLIAAKLEYKKKEDWYKKIGILYHKGIKVLKIVELRHKGFEYCRVR